PAAKPRGNMNVERIYSAYRDEAIAHQFTSEKYETFVAMPFKRLFSYNYERVLADVLKPAAVAANSLLETGLRCFAEPDVVRGRTATVITEDIIKDILFSHFFLGDLTFNNPGVLIESGVAMALKPNDQMILILDGDPRDLHFDIRNNRVLGY